MATMAMPPAQTPPPPLDSGNTNLPFPSLHLGSFDSKSPDDFASSPLPRPPHSTSPAGDKPSVQSWSLSSPSSSRTPVTSSPGGTAPLNLSRDRLASNRSARLAQSQSHSPPSSRLPIPPQLPPLNTRIHPSQSSGRAHSPLRSRADSGQSSSAGRPFTAPTFSSVSTALANSTDIPPKQSLTVHIPSAPFPPYDADGAYSVRQSPSVGRRRTIVQQAALVSQPSEASFEESMPERGEMGVDSGSSAIRNSSSPPRIERGSLVMPVACPTPASTAPTLRPSIDAPRENPQRTLEKKRSSADLKAPSPISPTPRRSLPRPPDVSNPPQVARQDVNGTVNEASKPTPRLPTAPSLAVKPRSRIQSQPAIPIVSGLADAGPYAAAASKAAAKPSPQRTSKLPKEEICLECMMRDRDLADVLVVGDGVWARTSDMDFDEMKSREAALLDSLGPDAVPSLDHSGSASVESDDESQPSSGHSMIDEARRRKRRDAKTTRRREVDIMVKNLGWRGFKWEERGTGLPDGFRGSKGMPLTESGIKAIMIKFPSSSAYRAENLDTYLYHQAILVRELRAEAKKKGGYAEPGTNLTPIVSPRSSSVEWEAKHARELSAHMRGVFDTTSKLDSLKMKHRSPLDPASTPNLEAPTVRPSPSSPADLSSLARTHIPKPVDRPATHFIPEREPRARGMTTMSSMATPSLRGIPADDMDEFWPPTPESGLRPFSFAVRAGAGGGGSVSGSDGHGRRTMFGRFGGSVTSFFGGSNHGSGSMMDMHLGLDADKQQMGYPRTASLASPPRQSFFARSRTSSIAEQEKRIRQSVSTSRLSQAIHPEDTKAKGFRGLLKKMKPKRDKDILQVQTPQIYQEGSLAPPPPMSYLDAATRQRSGSNSSLMTDNSSSLMGRQGFRSVSAPQAGSSSGGSQSASPTSSRYNRRESMYNAQTIGAEFLSPGSGMGEATIRGGDRTFRPHNKTSSSLSNSSLVTPPLGNIGTYNSFFAQPTRTSPKSVSSNRYTKMLPPVPRETSPDFGPIDYSKSPTTMYAEPSGIESVGSFGMRETYGQYGTRDPSKYGMRYSGESYSIREEERSVKGKKGKGFRLFGTKRN